MLEFTENQRAAIERTEGDVYVSAAAGSGKTAVLVERVVKIICDDNRRTPADRVLVVTFTKAAAAEMSARVKKRFDELLKKSPKNEWLQSQAQLIRRANISTVHAFCLSLLREFWSELGISPDFSLANEVYLDEIRQKALMNAAERLYGDESDYFREFSDLFGRSRSYTEALDTLESFVRFLSDVADPEQWRETVLAQLDNTRVMNDSSVGAMMLSLAARKVRAAHELLRSVIELMAATDEPLFLAYSRGFEYDLLTLKQLLELIDNGDRDDVVNFLDEYEPLRLANAPKEADRQLKKYVSDVRNMVK
ncbi:MAG: UvrD-helicase domain-containing protein, partial [Oscillospiraceae bacterium]|nr:UvrD-helicase domain-containing protein [Oscillospiraceae bacterium]